MNRVIFQQTILRQDLRNNPNVIYLFGDNCERTGYSEEDKEMRGEPNSIGIVVKKSQTNNFNDEEYNTNIVLIEQDIKRIPKYSLVVIPSEGIGTGDSNLQKNAPKTYNFLSVKLNELIQQQI